MIIRKKSFKINHRNELETFDRLKKIYFSKVVFESTMKFFPKTYN